MKNMAELKNILEGQLSIYKDILSLSEEKKEILIKSDLKKLEEIVEKEQNLILKIGELEDERYNNLMKIKDEIGGNVEDITLSQLVQRLDPNNDTKILETQKEMNSTLQSIEKANEQNSLLIEQALKQIDQSINLMANSREENSGKYEPDSKNEEKKGSKSFIDFKV